MFVEFFKRHIVLWALLAGLFVGSLNTSNDCDLAADRREPAYFGGIPNNDSCRANPGLCAPPPELFHRHATRQLVNEELKKLRIFEYEECINDPGCELLGVQQEEYDELIGERNE